MKKIYQLLFVALIGFTALTSCTEEDELPFGVIESPVLAQFSGQSFAPDESIVVTATFYDLDKSGILDQNVGIDSVRIPNLSVRVLVNETTEITTVTTGSDGTASFNQPWSSVGGPGNVRLEWVGEYEGKAFRVYHNIVATN